MYDDWGIPQNYRVMDGFGVHTFVLAAADGNQTYVKFHWQNRQGGEIVLATTAWAGAWFAGCFSHGVGRALA